MTFLAILVEHRLVTDRRTGAQTETGPCVANIALAELRGKNFQGRVLKPDATYCRSVFRTILNERCV